MLSFRDRFLSKIELIPFHECWEWVAHTDKDGYGTISKIENGKKRTLKAHKVSFEFYHGPINKFWVLHKCDNPGCVNPRHLYLGTAKDNAIDRENRGRSTGPKKTVCSNGHPYDSINTYLRPKGGRDCKVCKNTNWRNMYHRKRANKYASDS